MRSYNFTVKPFLFYFFKTTFNVHIQSRVNIIYMFDFEFEKYTFKTSLKTLFTSNRRISIQNKRT